MIIIIARALLFDNHISESDFPFWIFLITKSLLRLIVIPLLFLNMNEYMSYQLGRLTLYEKKGGPAHLLQATKVLTMTTFWSYRSECCCFFVFFKKGKHTHIYTSGAPIGWPALWWQAGVGNHPNCPDFHYNHCSGFFKGDLNTHEVSSSAACCLTVWSL